MDVTVGGEFDFKFLIFKYIAVITFIGISHDIAFRWIAQDPTDDMPTLVHDQMQFWPNAI